MVTFDSDGSSVVDSVDVVSGSVLTRPTPDPTRSGYQFIGWFKDAALTEPWDFANDIVTKDITLYAEWKDSLEFMI